MKTCFRKFVFLSYLPGLLLLLTSHFGGIGGCGDSGTSSDTTTDSSSVTLSAAVSLPSVGVSSSVGGLVVEGFKSATTEVAQSGMTAVFIDGDSDKELGQCKTGTDGTCVIKSSLSTGEHNIFVKVLDKNSNEVADSIKNTTVASDTSKVSTDVNTTEDLAYKAWQGIGCVNLLGVDS